MVELSKFVPATFGAAALGVAGVAFAGVVLAAPWAYGGVEQWFRAGVAATLAGCVGAVAFAALVAGRGAAREAAVVAALPLVGLVALASLQLSGGLPAAEAAVSLGPPRTIYPAATRLALAGLIAATAAALVGGVVFSRERPFHGLLFSCLASAAAVGFFGIALRLTGDDRVIRGLAVVGDPFARFVNRNNAAAFLQLGLAAGFALLRSQTGERSARRDADFGRRGWMAIDRGTAVFVVATLIAFCLAGVVASRSRGGMLAAVATVAAGLALFGQGRWLGRLALVVPCVLFAAALVAWLGLSAPAVERFTSLSLDEALADGRVPHWRDAMNAVAARPAFGAGFGTYGYAYQEFSERPAEGWYQHADNQFVELLVESGTAGVVIVVVGAVLAALGLRRGSDRPAERVLLGSLVAGQAVHALFDYGVIVPAVALPAAALWGAGLTRLLDTREEAAADGPGPFSRVLVFSAAAVVAAGLVWSRQEHERAWAVDRFSAAANRVDRPGGIEPERLEAAIERLTEALRDRPDDAEGHQAAARLYVYRYRTAASDALRRVDISLTDHAAWRATGLVSLHRAVNALARSGAEAGVAAAARDPVVVRDLAPARRHFEAAAAACPRLHDVWIPAAALAFLGPDGPGGTAELERFARLFPSDADSLRTAGRMAWQAGDADLARRCWRRSFAVNPAGYWEFVGGLATEAGAAEAVALTCPEGAGPILRIATNAGPESGVELRRAVGDRAAAAAEGTPPGPARERLLVAADRLAGRLAEAERRARSAVAADPTDAAARAVLARVLWDANRHREALEEAAVAVALDPRDEDFRRQRESWSRNASERPAARSSGLP